MPPPPYQYNKIRPDRHLVWMAMALAAALSLLSAALHLLILEDPLSVGEALLDSSVIVLSVALFGAWTLRRLRQREAQIQYHVEHLEALHTATTTISAELDLGVVLQEVVDLSRKLVRARYGALGELAADQRFFNQFVTSGLTEEQCSRIGRMPQGQGLLGAPVRADTPLRVASVADDLRSVGYPPHHPVMRTLLSVPIRAKGRVIGILYLADKRNDQGESSDAAIPFTDEDEAIVSMFATQAAIAIENARLYRQQEALIVLQERERIGRDLHDGTIQSIYAVGLMLEDAQHRVETEPQTVRDRIAQSIHNLNDVILDIRNYILDLQPQRVQHHDLQAGLEALVHDLRVDSFINVDVSVEAPEAGRLSAAQTAEVLHIAQEALANVQRHALATQVNVSLQCKNDKLLLTIEDNGTGFDPDAIVSMGGLHNMKERAQVLNGQLEINSVAGAGSRLRLSAPL